MRNTQDKQIGQDKSVGGSTEVAKALGISKQRLAQLRERPDFPHPVAELASGSVWNLTHITRWGTSSARRPSGRPAADDSRRLLGGRFELEAAPIGVGGFADVYRAVDRLGTAVGDNQIVAVKILNLKMMGDDDVNARGRFARELRLLQSITHPHIIPVIASGDDAEGERPWYAMPLAHGSLLDYLPKVAGDDRAILDVMRQVCAGLRYLHETAGIFHRDLTPMNVLLTESGAWALSDFGLAREAERRTTALTSTVAHLGTFFYQAPEAMGAAREAGIPADIYSLGKVLQALVIGEHPLPASPPPNGLFRHIIIKATRFDIPERYHSVDDMLTDIEHAVNAEHTWHSTTEDILGRLRARVLAGEHDALDELLETLHDVNEGDDQNERKVFVIMTHLSEEDIAYLWHHDADAFRAAFDRYARNIAHVEYTFEFCDTLADFACRAVRVTEDKDVLRTAITGLCGLGHRHNRWYVRSVLLTILQGVHAPELANAALMGLHAANPIAGRWSLEQEPFVLRSLYPTLRDGVREVLKQEEQDSEDAS